jgi:hypothetical protein
MKDIERIAKLEIQVENLFKENEKLQNANRKLKVEVYQMQKQLRFFIWNGKAWKNVFASLILFGLYFCVVDMLFSTEKFHAWFSQKALPWAVHRIVD